eukprot:m.334131 g.334131  ORF g.334131 m.334131 type:complete len:605 (+) comp17298_c0_seq1:144-1958(+)
MGKRGADRQIRKSDGEEEDDEDSFSAEVATAPTEILKTRKIIAAGRKRNKTDEAGAPAKKAGVFGGLSFGNTPKASFSFGQPSATSGASTLFPNAPNFGTATVTTTSNSLFGTSGKVDPGVSPFGSQSKVDPGVSPFGSKGKVDPGVSPFGSKASEASTKPLFGTPASNDTTKPLFGTSTSSAEKTKPLFGTSTSSETTKPLFGTSSSSTDATSKPSFSSSPFGSKANDVTPSLFGASKQDPSVSPFGSNAAETSKINFGAPKASGPNLFGSSKVDPADNPFKKEFSLPKTSTSSGTEDKKLEEKKASPFSNSLLTSGTTTASLATTPADDTVDIMKKLSKAGLLKAASQFKVLNETFHRMIQEEIKRDEVVNLVPCLQEYIKFASSILNDASKIKDEGPDTKAIGKEESGTSAKPSSGSADIEGSIYSTKAKMYYKKHFKKEGEDEKIVYKQKEVEEGLKNKDITEAWTVKGKGTLALVDRDGKMGLLLVAAKDEDDNSSTTRRLLNIGLSAQMKKTIIRKDKKDILIMCLPNPPLHPKCVVCGDSHKNPKESNHCDNLCWGEGCTDDKKGGIGTKAKLQSILLRTASTEIADQLHSKIMDSL